MKAFYLFGVILLLLTVAGVYAFFSSPGAVTDPSVVMIMTANVGPETIDLKASFAASAIWYSGYTAEYKGEALFVQVLSTQWESRGQGSPFIVSIPNTFGPVKEVYLKGPNPQTIRKVWPTQDKVSP